jgi:hypothetical protein
MCVIYIVLNKYLSLITQKLLSRHILCARFLIQFKAGIRNVFLLTYLYKTQGNSHIVCNKRIQDITVEDETLKEEEKEYNQ